MEQAVIVVQDACSFTGCTFQRCTVVATGGVAVSLSGCHMFTAAAAVAATGAHAIVSLTHCVLDVHSRAFLVDEGADVVAHACVVTGGRGCTGGLSKVHPTASFQQLACVFVGGGSGALAP
jgi:hypothetical protein